MALLLSSIAELVGGSLIGPDTEVRGVATLADAGPGDLGFVDDPRFLSDAEASRATALLVHEGVEAPGKAVVQVKRPRLAFAAVLRLFETPRALRPGIHATALVEEGASVDPSASVGAYAFVGAGAAVGANVALHPYAYLGAHVTVGEGSEIYPHAVLYEGVTLGRRVTVHSGAVIGSDGFGYDFVDGRHVKIPHVGSVRIEDDVEIGANTTIDRAKTGLTRIGTGSKIDNLVQIGHNVQVGDHCVIVAQVGLCGSCQLEEYVVVGGQAAVAEHHRIGRGATLAARAGAAGDVAAGETVSGMPTRPHKQWLRTQAALQRLPDALRRLNELERRLAALESPKAKDAPGEAA